VFYATDDVKPAPDLFLLAAERIGVPPSLCVGYEDAKLGMEAIKNARFMAGVDVTRFEGYPRLC
jgi:HAD superfamily hydrolase (TIGR01509 family)